MPRRTKKPAGEKYLRDGALDLDELKSDLDALASGKLDYDALCQALRQVLTIGASKSLSSPGVEPRPGSTLARFRDALWQTLVKAFDAQAEGYERGRLPYRRIADTILNAAIIQLAETPLPNGKRTWKEVSEALKKINAGWNLKPDAIRIRYGRLKKKSRQ